MPLSQLPGRSSSSPLRLVVGVLAHPSKTLSEVSKARPLPWAIALVLAMAAVSALSWWASPSLSLGQEQAPGRPAGWVILLSSIVGYPILFAVLVAVYHAIALALGGSGSFRGLFAALAYSNVPYFLSAPLAGLTLWLGQRGEALFILGALALFTWTSTLNVIAVKENYGLSVGKTLSTLLAPWIVVLAGVIILAMVLLAIGEPH